MDDWRYSSYSLLVASTTGLMNVGQRGLSKVPLYHYSVAFSLLWLFSSRFLFMFSHVLLSVGCILYIITLCFRRLYSFDSHKIRIIASHLAFSFHSLHHRLFSFVDSIAKYTHYPKLMSCSAVSCRFTFLELLDICYRPSLGIVIFSY